eukprot:CAMPEP_0202048658 /NCGR_PEP_ID=MMETSP0963-20130614/2856_1 /ASSEMBLY_ACC=CAM_ASM_000494 /TAXON_ID=4773 /ORGANISM="Schizochytrium aggregatum, Strain ATCC28209" /LENGTH=31 /DNA_ID= /DNA_START= /DNA_END= /DNA_ORIENTATION=
MPGNKVAAGQHGAAPWKKAVGSVSLQRPPAS